MNKNINSKIGIHSNFFRFVDGLKLFFQGEAQNWAENKENGVIPKASQHQKDKNKFISNLQNKLDEELIDVTTFLKQCVNANLYDKNNFSEFNLR